MRLLKNQKNNLEFISDNEALFQDLKISAIFDGSGTAVILSPIESDKSYTFYLKRQDYHSAIIQASELIKEQGINKEVLEKMKSRRFCYEE